jgi:hypothetical protein
VGQAEGWRGDWLLQECSLFPSVNGVGSVGERCTYLRTGNPTADFISAPL